MIKFKIDECLFNQLSVRIRQNLIKSGFRPVSYDVVIHKVKHGTLVEDYNLHDLKIGEAYSIFGFPVMPIQQKTSRIKKQDGMVYTVNERLGIVLRIK